MRLSNDELKTKYPTEYELGLAEAYDVFGMTYDGDPESDRSRAYDIGRNEGEDEAK